MRILLVEDHLELAGLISKALQAIRLQVEHVATGNAADSLLLTQDYALLILDLSLPDLDGMEVLKRLRQRHSSCPVLILTARGSLQDKVAGLNAGADDYLAKPFDLAELEARVKALLRRGQQQESVHLQCGDLQFDTLSRQFFYAGQVLSLTPREYAVLEMLISKPGQAIAKDKLYAGVFSLDDEANKDAIEIYVHRLRKKLEGLSAGKVVIVTLRGIGYLLEARP